jgi:hypothetical protein
MEEVSLFGVHLSVRGEENPESEKLHFFTFKVGSVWVSD